MTPPALWEEGINGAFLDYSANVSITEEKEGDKRTYLSTNGTAGINLGVWRFRGDYSAIYQKSGVADNHKKYTILILAVFMVLPP